MKYLLILCIILLAGYMNAQMPTRVQVFASPITNIDIYKITPFRDTVHLEKQRPWKEHARLWRIPYDTVISGHLLHLRLDSYVHDKLAIDSFTTPNKYEIVDGEKVYYGRRITFYLHNSYEY